MSSSDRPLIMLVDDDTTVGWILETVLEDEGFDLARVEWGNEAVETAVERRPAAIVLDLKLPDSDGQQVLRNLKNTPSLWTVPVIICSAVTHSLTADDHFLAQEVLPKPFDIQLLLDALRRLGVTAAAG